MQPVVRVGAWVVAVVIVITVAAGWLRARPELEPEDAARVAVAALADAGFEATVVGDVVLGTYVPADAAAGTEPIDVWDVSVDVAGETIETKVKLDAGVIVFIDDNVGVADPARLLSQEQFDTLDAFSDDTAYDEQTQKNGLATAAGTVGLLAALAHTVIPGRSRGDSEPGSPSTDMVSDADLQELIA